MNEEIPPVFFMGVTVGFVFGAVTALIVAFLVFHGAN